MFKCPYCSVRYSLFRSLVYHVTGLHNGDRCVVCGKQNISIKSHVVWSRDRGHVVYRGLLADRDSYAGQRLALRHCRKVAMELTRVAMGRGR